MTKIRRMKRIQKLMDELIMKEDHEKFLRYKHWRLGNQRPIDLLRTEKGYKEVHDLLKSIEAGDFS